MKIKRLFKNLIIILVLFLSFSVNAEEHDVVAKYSESKNIVTYESIIHNGECSVKVDTGTITINSISDSLNGANLVIIRTTDDALNWISEISNSDNNYYLYFEKNSLKLDVNEKIVVKFTSNDGVVKELMIFNTLGDLVSKSNDSVFSYKTNFYFSFSDVVNGSLSNEMNLNIGSNGKVMINGTFYKGSTNSVFDEETVRVAIIPDNGYEVLEILYNGKDITDSLKSGFITLKLKEPNKLDVNFASKKVSGEGLYKISGRVKFNGKVLSDAIVILNDKEKVVTDSKGFYEFENVPAGVNSLLIMKDDKGIGYATFEILSNNINDINTYDNNLFVIEISEDNFGFVMDVNVNDDYSIDFTDVKLNTNYNLWWLLLIGLVLIVIVFTIVFNKGKK